MPSKWPGLLDLCSRLKAHQLQQSLNVSVSQEKTVVQVDVAKAVPFSIPGTLSRPAITRNHAPDKPRVTQALWYVSGLE